MIRLLDAVTGYLAALLLMAFTVIVLVDVVFRYWIKIPLTWPAESSVLLFQWSVFLGAALAVHRRMHFGLDLVVRLLPDHLRRAAEGFVLVAVVIVAGMLVVLGTDMTRRAWPSRYPTLPLSHGVAYLGVAVSGALMLLFSLPQLVAFAKQTERPVEPR